VDREPVEDATVVVHAVAWLTGFGEVMIATGSRTSATSTDDSCSRPDSS
jgi:hypothetical protein